MRKLAHKDVRHWQLHLRRKLPTLFTVTERHWWLVRLNSNPDRNRHLAHLARQAEWLDRHDKSGWVRWLAWAHYWRAAGNPILASLYRWTATKARKSWSPVRERHTHRSKAFVAIEQIAAPPAR